MWSTESAWFDIAVVMAIFAIGNLFFGHFEEHKPKALRVLKVVGFGVLVGALTAAGLRWVAYGLIAFFGLAALYVHGFWLPRHGVNGLTAEPWDKYYELLKVPRDKRTRCRDTRTLNA
jgi:hypothetical protein